MNFDLRQWTEAFRQDFADMHADPEIMADLGGPFDREESNRKFDRYRDGWVNDGISRWSVVDKAGGFLGYAGVKRAQDLGHPLGDHFEIGWRFKRTAWGQGFASRSAALALEHAWTVIDAAQIFSYTAADNLRSQAVMERLDLVRDKALDFTAPYPSGLWSGLVWRADRL